LLPWDGQQRRHGIPLLVMRREEVGLPVRSMSPPGGAAVSSGLVRSQRPPWDGEWVIRRGAKRYGPALLAGVRSAGLVLTARDIYAGRVTAGAGASTCCLLSFLLSTSILRMIRTNVRFPYLLLLPLPTILLRPPLPRCSAASVLLPRSLASLSRSLTHTLTSYILASCRPSPKLDHTHHHRIRPGHFRCARPRPVPVISRERWWYRATRTGLPANASAEEWRRRGCAVRACVHAFLLFSSLRTRGAGLG
jgi:hypothetical protein